MPNSSVRLFLSYRRADLPDMVGRIYDVLLQTFQEEGVVLDVHALEPGDAFPTMLAESISNSTSVLALIGPHWVSGDAQSPSPGIARSRLLDPDDYVRRELEFAVSRGIPIVPVLLGDSELPAPHELPSSLAELLKLNAIRVRRDPDFSKDTQQLIEVAWKHRRVDGRFLGTLSLPRIPADLILPLSTLVRSAVFSRQITIAVASGQDFKNLYKSNAAAIQAMDHTISTWAALFGHEDPPDVPKQSADDVEFKNSVDRAALADELRAIFQTIDLQSRIGAALDYYDMHAEEFNRWHENLPSKLDVEMLEREGEVAGRFLANVLSSFDMVETIVTPEFKQRMRQAWNAGDMAPLVERMSYYFHLMRGVEAELRACVAERQQRLLRQLSVSTAAMSSL